MNAMSNGREKILPHMLDLLNEMKIDYYVIGGPAVNANVEPVVSLDAAGITEKRVLKWNRCA